MSDSATNNSANTRLPKAIIHKKILDAAEDRPSASLEEIAEDVSGASPRIVNKVLSEYGDPVPDDSLGAKQPDDSVNKDAGNDSTIEDPAGKNLSIENHSENTLHPDDLTNKQLETLRVISQHPQASQRELAERLDVSAATISNRVNSIESFEWSERASFADEILAESGDSDDSDVSPERKDMYHKFSSKIDRLREQLSEVQATAEESSSSHPVFDDSEFAHKIIRASIDAEYISTEEEQKIMQALMEDTC